VEPHGLKPVLLHMLQRAGTLRSIPNCAPLGLRRVPLAAFIYGLKDRSFLRRRGKAERKELKNHEKSVK